MSRRIIILALILVGLFITIQAVEAGPQPTPSGSPDWSKGIPVGVAGLNNQVEIQVDGRGHVFLVWIDLEKKIHWMELEESGKIVQDSTLDLELNSPRWPQMVLDPEGVFHLLWLDWQDGGDRLFYARVDQEGRVVSEPRVISGSSRVEEAELVLVPGGLIQVLWIGRQEGESALYRTALDFSGRVVLPNRLLVAGAEDVAAGEDGQGLIHLAWVMVPAYNVREIWYGTVHPQSAGVEGITRLAKVNLVTQAGHILWPPAIGLDGEYGYVFWPVEQRGRAAASFLHYARFSLDAPQQHSQELVLIPSSLDFEYQPASGELGYRSLALPSGSGRGATEHVAEPQALPGQFSEMALVFTMLPQGEYQGRLRVGTAFFREGELIGYQLVNTPRGASLKPNITRGPDGELHLVWLETKGFDQYLVYYASTDPQMVARLSPVTLREAMNWILGATASLSLILLYLPLLLAWIVLPLFGILVFYLVTGSGDLSKISAKFILVAASLFYLLAVMAYPPSRGQELWWEARLEIVTGGLALGIAALYLWRSQIRSLLATFLLFAFSQGVLRLAFHILSSQGYIF
ncbi:MAG: hypothetical protein HYX86_01040 [Chloroflexi bacterium]|nr:hypothetical protein [Chloroflexota bacterium]